MISISANDNHLRMKYKKVLEMSNREDKQKESEKYCIRESERKYTFHMPQSVQPRNLIFSLLVRVFFLTPMLCRSAATCTSLLIELRAKIPPSISRVTQVIEIVLFIETSSPSDMFWGNIRSHTSRKRSPCPTKRAMTPRITVNP